MGIATLVKYCAKCDDYYSKVFERCPCCGELLEEKAVINVQELRGLVDELRTPRGLVKLLASFKKFMED